MLQQKRQNQRLLLDMLRHLLSRKPFYCDSDVESGVGEPSSKVVFECGLVGLVVMLEEVNAVVLAWEVLQLIP